MSQVLTRKVVISKFYGKISMLVTVPLPSHLEKLCSIRIFWLEKLNGSLVFIHEKNPTKQHLLPKFQCRKQTNFFTSTLRTEIINYTYNIPLKEILQRCYHPYPKRLRALLCQNQDCLRRNKSGSFSESTIFRSLRLLLLGAQTRPTRIFGSKAKHNLQWKEEKLMLFLVFGGEK